MSKSHIWKCRSCGETLTDQKVVFDYLSLNFSETLKRCPKCGRVLIEKELANGKMIEVETQLEEK
ncbi:Zn-finger domain associated with topoisomerase type I [Clostridium sp. SY8519]|uniref:DVU_1557 family redox protein n=1 Tax=Clostridium sp. (strain SY8519) TaxID=1042156 RepID=UPI0002171BA3|nr:CLJU_RS11820 family redox protein [Clostridium sp. SY8519]BAK46450.1 Zn-finger domain associated with topoisomerase type I [Clostridium sp. SY8519]